MRAVQAITYIIEFQLDVSNWRRIDAFGEGPIVIIKKKKTRNAQKD